MTTSSPTPTRDTTSPTGRSADPGAPKTRRRGRTALVGLAVGATLLVAACAPRPASPVPLGEAGAQGPCGVEERTVPNPADATQGVSVVLPSGSASPWTGGTCGDGARPVVLVAHGYLGGSVAVYRGLVDHLVSNGFVVVFPSYSNALDPAQQYAVVDAGLGAAAAWFPGRVDTARVGVVGHSMGAGMAPWLLNRVAARGWGSASLWSVMLAPWYSFQVGSGPIAVPPGARMTVMAFEDDRVADARIGIETFEALQLPEDRTAHVSVRSDWSASPPLVADHMEAVSMDPSLDVGSMRTDHFDHWAVFRSADATARCALDGTWCDVDLSYVGAWPDGRSVLPAVVSDDPVDAGPPAAQECSGPLNPRPCPA